MFDEIQCGMGRTGTLWAYEQTGVVPDAMTSAKALGGGLPIGALITGERLADVFHVGDHGSTFAGGPLVASAALVALEICSDPLLLESVVALGERLAAGLALLPYVERVRGRGLMLAIDLVDGVDAPDLARRALLEQRLVVNATGPATIRLEPPLVVSAEEIDEALGAARSAGAMSAAPEYLSPDETRRRRGGGGARRATSRQVRDGRDARPTATYYDTFDGLLHRAGLTLASRGRRAGAARPRHRRAARAPTGERRRPGSRSSSLPGPLRDALSPDRRRPRAAPAGARAQPRAARSTCSTTSARRSCGWRSRSRRS